MIKFDVDTQKYIADSPEKYAKFVDCINTFISDNYSGIAIVEWDIDKQTGHCVIAPTTKHVGTCATSDLLDGNMRPVIDYYFRWSAFYKHSFNNGLVLEKSDMAIDRYNLSDDVVGIPLFEEDCFTCSTADMSR